MVELLILENWYVCKGKKKRREQKKRVLILILNVMFMSCVFSVLNSDFVNIRQNTYGQTHLIRKVNQNGMCMSYVVGSWYLSGIMLTSCTLCKFKITISHFTF